MRSGFCVIKSLMRTANASSNAAPINDKFMCYDYLNQKAVLFTDDGSRLFLKVRDKVHHHLKEGGAFKMDATFSIGAASHWDLLACVDRLVELGEIREITPPDVAGQDRVFVRT